MTTIIRGNAEMLQEMLNVGLSINSLDKAGNTALHWACRSGHSNIVSLLLKHGNCLLNAQNKLGDTPLHCAAWGGHSQVIRLLLDSDCEPPLDRSIKNGQGLTARDLAKNDESAALLTQLNASLTDLNRADYDPESD
jgi:ankyrin repeat protein